MSVECDHTLSFFQIPSLWKNKPSKQCNANRCKCFPSISRISYFQFRENTWKVNTDQVMCSKRICWAATRNAARELCRKATHKFFCVVGIRRSDCKKELLLSGSVFKVCSRSFKEGKQENRDDALRLMRKEARRIAWDEIDREETNQTLTEQKVM